MFARLSPEGFERCFVAWTQALRPSSQGQFLALDGKALRGSFVDGWKRTPIHMVSAYASDHRLILGQLKVESKENEIVALPKLLEMLDLRHTTVTIDAIGCQKQIARQIVEAKGHYVLALKDNQPTLHDQVKAQLDEAILENFQGLQHDYYEATEGDHGRIETRKVWVCNTLRWVKAAADWPGLRQVAVVESRREIKGQVSTERRYYIASHGTLDAKRTAPGDPSALGHRESDALGIGCDLQRGPVPDPPGERPGELFAAAANGAQQTAGLPGPRRQKTLPAHETQNVQLELCQFPQGFDRLTVKCVCPGVVPAHRLGGILHHRSGRAAFGTRIGLPSYLNRR